MYDKFDVAKRQSIFGRFDGVKVVSKVMKVKKLSVKLILCLLTALVFAGALTACNKTPEEKKFDFLVTFDYNEGNAVADADKKPNQTLGVLNNGLVSIRPGYNNSFEEGKFDTYYVEGWYLPKLSAGGDVIVNEETGIVELDREWNFREDRVTEPVTLYAKLGLNAKLIYVDIETGEEVGFMRYAPGYRRDKPSASSLRPSKLGYTFLEKYYVDEARTEEFTWPYVFTTEDKRIYVDMVEGNWQVVSTPSEFASQINANTNIYLVDDIDFADYDGSMWGTTVDIGGETYYSSVKAFNGTINGNNHKVLNLSRKLQASKANGGDYMGGVFGQLGATANIYDITFENVNVEYSVHSSLEMPGLYVGLFAWKADNGAKISNVTVTGTITYSKLKERVIGSRWIAKNNAKPEDINNVNYDGVREIILPDPEESAE